MHVNRSPLTAGSTSGSYGNWGIQRVQDAGERIAIAHLQFNLGRHRERSAAVHNPAHGVGWNVVAVYDREVAVDQIVV
jgi:hypothetical protein